MNYIKITIRIDSEAGFIADVLSACLGEVGFDSFEETSRGINAYCPENIFSDTALSDIIKDAETSYGCKISFRKELLMEQNWNATWEQDSFEPIVVSDQIAIFPTSHAKDFCDRPFRYKIELNPVQAFGSGYHETTRMMLQFILEEDMDGKSLLDMGCGTAVLAILARLKGASPVFAIDIDHWSTENAVANSALNGVPDINIVLGDATAIKPLRTDFGYILANINRNILVADMAAYVAALARDGKLIMSGFYSEDLPIIDDAAKVLCLHRIKTKTTNNWVAAKYVRD